MLALVVSLWLAELINKERGGNMLSNAAQLIINLSRVHLTKEIIEESKKLIPQVDWSRLFTLAVKNKVIQLVWSHLRLFPETYEGIDSQYLKIFNMMYQTNKEKNKITFQEMVKLSKALEQEGTLSSPLKGGLLAYEVFSEGQRSMNDLDFLISRDDLMKVVKVMKELGYVMGKYDPITKEIKQVSREVDVFWKINLNNLHPFVKSMDNIFEYFDVDFSFYLDMAKNHQSTVEMLERGIYRNIGGQSLYCLDVEDFLIQVCTHLFKEATNVFWVSQKADLNLIKFCDVREYVLQYQYEIDWDLFIERVRKYGYDKAIYYCFYYIKVLFNDDFCDQILAGFDLDENFLNEYGQNDYDKSVKWEKDFMNRLFSVDNFSEIKEVSMYQKFINNQRGQ